MRDYRESLDGFAVNEIIEIEREPGIRWRIDKLWVNGRKLHLASLVCNDPGTHNRLNRKVGTRKNEINTCFFRKLPVAASERNEKRKSAPMATNATSIRIDSVHISRTYAGVLEGLPTPEQTIAHAKASAKQLCGERPMLVVLPVTTLPQQPEASRLNLPRERCPPWCVIAWLQGPALKDGDGSDLVVIWFQDAPGFEIPSALLHDLSCDAWEKHAKDWWF